MNKEELRKVFVNEAVKHDHKSDKAIWLSSVWCEKVVGGYERGETLGLADDMSRSVDTIEDRSHGYSLFKQLCLLDDGAYRRFVFAARRASYVHFSHFRALWDAKSQYSLTYNQVLDLLMDIVQGEGQISSRGVDGHVRERFGDTRGWEFYAQRTQKELGRLLKQPDLPSEAREKAGILFSYLGDKA